MLPILHYKDYETFSNSIEVDEKNFSVNKNDLNSISFTPYIYNTCSANCRFCSEQLTRDGKVMVCDSVSPDYQNRLAHTFDLLINRPVFLSISGKEPSESLDLVQSILNEANCFVEKGGRIIDRVMYSNLSGFYKDEARFIKLITQGKLTRIECSRHHLDEAINQQIVRFHKGEKIKENAAFIHTIKCLQKYVPIKIVCVLQRSGISTVSEILEYIDYMKKIGITDIVFRELAMFENNIDTNTVSKYICDNRVELLSILKELPKNMKCVNVKKGYYYYSFCYKYKGVFVDFEFSDYDEMIKHHYNNDVLSKIILYPNGMICRDWNLQGEISAEDEIKYFDTTAVNRDIQEMYNIAEKICLQNECILIGSLGEKLTISNLVDRFPSDIDILASDKSDNLLSIMNLIKSLGFTLYSWQDKITDDFDMTKLKNRLYFRGIRDSYIVDVTYELTNTSFEVLKNYMVICDNIKTLSPSGFKKLFEATDRIDKKRMRRLMDLRERV